MHCASCGSQIEVKGRLQFRERCPQCDTALHTCVHCCFYDANAYNQCRETKAERQVEKKRENRCEYFSANEQKPSSQKQGGTQGSSPRDAFASLFTKKEVE
jgi:hypothetical protein